MDHLQPVDHKIWIYAMANHSCSIPRFFPLTFQHEADNLLERHLKMKRSKITTDNWKIVYLFLIDNMIIL